MDESARRFSDSACGFKRMLFVDLRGFDPDAAQPPGDPAAVLDGFLRLLGMPICEYLADLGH